jgi:integrase
MGPTTDQLQQVPGGWRGRFRYGKGQRIRLVIKIADQSAAERRARGMRALAATLTSGGHSEQAPLMLAKAAEADEATFKTLQKFAEGLCRGKVKAEARVSSTTFRELGKQWTDGTLHKRHPDHVKLKRSVDDDVSRLTKLYETIGDVPLVGFRLEDAERAMAAIPRGLASGTRRHYGQLIAKVLRLAVYPCKIIDRSPLPEKFLPTVKGHKATAYLYPDEDAKLMACQAVPLDRRVLYGFLAREGLRLGEALALRWKDLDLTRGTVRLDENKTDDPRSWTLSEGVPESLGALRPKGEKGEALVFAGIAEDGAAKVFRGHLAEANIERPELFERSKNRSPIRLHDLRATFVTLSLANGKTESWVADRTGHRSSQMINRYRRQARQVTELSLGGLARLDVALGVGQKVGQLPGPRNPKKSESSRIPAVGRRGLEPRTDGFETLDQPTGECGTAEKGSVVQPKGQQDAPLAQAGPPLDPVETALADAIAKAAAAGAWEAVAACTAELRARREARVNVVSLEAARRRKGQ